jgi:hypothetical protein
MHPNTWFHGMSPMHQGTIGSALTVLALIAVLGTVLAIAVAKYPKVNKTSE